MNNFLRLCNILAEAVVVMFCRREEFSATEEIYDRLSDFWPDPGNMIDEGQVLSPADSRVTAQDSNKFLIITSLGRDPRYLLPEHENICKYRLSWLGWKYLSTLSTDLKLIYDTTVTH